MSRITSEADRILSIVRRSQHQDLSGEQPVNTDVVGRSVGGEIWPPVASVLRVFGYRDRYEPKGKFTNFLFVLARHVWADAGRRAQRRPEVLSETLDEGPDPDEPKARR